MANPRSILTHSDPRPGGGRWSRWAEWLPYASFRTPHWTLLLVLMATAFPSGSQAQSVRGRILASETELPIEGALILLLDEAGGDQHGSLSNENGWFLIRAPRPGRYALRAERIGFESVTSDFFDLVPGEEYDQSFHLSQKAIELEELRVLAERRCVVRPADGLVLTKIWEEARKALTSQEWTEREGLHQFLIQSYERELDPETRLAVWENRQETQWVTGNPIRSLPVEELLRDGFIQRDPRGGFHFFGPDAKVLLSDEFLDTHCIGLEEWDREPGLIGLSFEPVGRRSSADISGTLWLDRWNVRLKFIEFGYTWSPWPEAIGVSEGQVHFEELPDGSWIVRRWWIRMPKMVLGASMVAGGRSGYRVAGIMEAGGEVIRTASTPNTRHHGRLQSRGTLEGIVWDSISDGALAQATVFLSGTQYSATTDSAGFFRLPNVPEGFYRASFLHPALDSLGVSPSGVEVRVPAGRVAEVALATPSQPNTVAALCRETGSPEEKSALVGTVRDFHTGEPVPGATVVLEWQDWRVEGGREFRGDVQTVSVGTDQRGRYRACARRGAMVRVRAVLSGKTGMEEEVRLPQRGIATLDLRIGTGGA